MRGQTLAGRADALTRVLAAGRAVHTSTEVAGEEVAGDLIRVSLDNGETLSVPGVIVQIGFVAGKETFNGWASFLVGGIPRRGSVDGGGCRVYPEALSYLPRATGKTTLTLNAILAQPGTDVVCVCAAMRVKS